MIQCQEKTNLHSGNLKEASNCFTREGKDLEVAVHLGNPCIPCCTKLKQYPTRGRIMVYIVTLLFPSHATG